MSLRIVALSDTHGYHNRLTIPDGDVLVYAGDFSMRAKLNDTVDFAAWFNALPHTHKIMIPGNHDMYCEQATEYARQEFAPAIFLDHQECEVMGYRFFGSPYSSCIFEPSIWHFDYPPLGEKAHRLWESIPAGIDVLITHGPPKGILDRVDSVHPGEDPNVGDPILLKNVKRVNPKVHIFGHIHEGYGAYYDGWTKFHNVCVCTVQYKPHNPITVIDL